MFDQTTSESLDIEFLSDVIRGLESEPKRLPSKYFYNKKGDSLFQRIMELEEYYLTRAEHEIFVKYRSEILKMFSPNGQSFNLVEFGAGDGQKTKVLLKEFLNSGAIFKYVPIDISANALMGLEASLRAEMPDLDVQGMQGDYFEVLDQLSHSSSARNILLFLGSNIGNFTDDEAHDFLRRIRDDLHDQDLLLIGIDLKKDPEKILAAYNDHEGVTAAFNLNLLERINEELDADFDIGGFRHHASYDPVNGECKSALISLRDQEVQIHGECIFFEKWEPIHTEISKKYSLSQIHRMAAAAGFEIEADLMDSNAYFVDSIWRAV